MRVSAAARYAEARIGRPARISLREDGLIGLVARARRAAFGVAVLALLPVRVGTGVPLPGAVSLLGVADSGIRTPILAGHLAARQPPRARSRLGRPDQRRSNPTRRWHGRYRELGYSVPGVSDYQHIAAFHGVDTHAAVRTWLQRRQEPPAGHRRARGRLVRLPVLAVAQQPAVRDRPGQAQGGARRR